MKLNITALALSIITTTSLAQSKHQKAIQKSLQKKSVEISLDTVFYSGEAWFTLSGKTGNNLYYNTKEVKTLTNVLAATITKLATGSYGMVSTFYIEFPSITGKSSITKNSYETCMQTLFNNNVFKNKALDAVAAKQFIKTYGYVEHVYDEATVNNTGNQNISGSLNSSSQNSSSSSKSNFIHAQLCSSCGFGSKKDNCTKCDHWTGGNGIDARLCSNCGFGNKKDNCVKCGKWTGGNGIDAKLDSNCGFGNKKDNCVKCGQWAP